MLLNLIKSFNNVVLLCSSDWFWYFLWFVFEMTCKETKDMFEKKFHIQI